MGADEGPHSLHQALLAAGEQHARRRGSPAGSARAPRPARARSATPGGVVVGAGDDVGELDVDEQEDADQQDQGRDQLEDARSGRESTPAIRAPRIGRRTASDQKRTRNGPEGNGRRSASRAARATRFGRKTAPGAGGVVVGAEEEAGGRVGPLAGGDDVLGGAAEEQPAQQVEAGVQVEVHRDGRDQHDREADRRAGRSRRRLPAKPSAQCARVDERRTGDARRWARPRRGARRRGVASRASWRPGARRRCRPAGPRTSTARGSLPCGRRRPRAGDYRGAVGSTRAWRFSHAYDW